jgi:lysophospholipase L1-like esterase|nr:GDSL-type esterase/lipase family protein [Kofleriaceae bacterium]
MRWVAAPVLLTSSLALASPKDTAPPAATFDDKDALAHFHSALAAQRAGTADHPLRVSYFGDSLTADDQITGALRDRLQKLVGDGGAGYLFAVEPHPYNEHKAVVRWTSANWRVWGISSAIPNDRLLGLGGSAETDDDGAVLFAPTGPAATVDVAYLAQPHGGKLEVTADGKTVQTIDTAGTDKADGYAHVALPDGTKKIGLRAHGRVRLFGASLEAAKGAVVDNLGVVNATAKGLATNDLGDHLKDELAHRAPDLAVVMLGTNEAEWLAPRGYGMDEHAKVFDALLQSIHDANPNASCLVISPLDQLDWRTENMPPRASVPAMVEVQRTAAHAHGCAFWDTYQWMGGKGSSADWYRRGWIVKDFQHPTTAGATRLADALYAGLVEAP